MLDVPGPAASCCAACTRARSRSWRSRRRPPRRSPPRCCSTTSPPTCTRATRPNAERRAAALSLDRDLLRELLGQEELRELIDAGRARSASRTTCSAAPSCTRATGRDGLHDVLRRVGDLTREEVARARARRASTRRRCSPSCERERRAIAPAHRRRGALRRRRRGRPVPRRARRGAARRPAGGVPGRTCPTRCASSSRATRARTARSRREELRERYGVDAGAVLRELERDGELVRGELRPGGSEREWCDVEVLRRLRRASLAALRKEIEPADAARAWRPSCPPGRASTATRRAGAGVDRLREVLVPLQGLALPVEIWERDVLPRRTGAYSPTWLDSLCASGELVWVGAGAARARSGRVALYFREDAPPIGPPPRGAAARARAQRAPDGRRARAAARAPARSGPCFFTDLLAELDAPGRGAARGAVGSRVGGRGHQRRVGAAAAPRLALARGGRAARQRGRGGRHRARARARARSPLRRARRAGGRQVQGRWSLTAPVFGAAPAEAAGRRRRAPARARRAAARALRHRHPRAGARRGDQGRLRDALRRVLAASRRSASAVAATSSRAWAAPSSRCPARSSGCARCAAAQSARAGEPRARSCSPPPIRPSPTAPRCRGRTREGQRPPPGARRRRVRGARRRRAGAVRRARRPRPAHARPSTGLACRGALRLRWRARARRCAPGGSASWRSSASTASRRSARAGEALIELGFRSGPRRLTLSA